MVGSYAPDNSEMLVDPNLYNSFENLSVSQDAAHYQDPTQSFASAHIGITMDNTPVDQQYVYGNNVVYDPASGQQYSYSNELNNNNGESSTTGAAGNQLWCDEENCRNPGPFSRPCDLRKHQNNHTRPRACDICPESDDPRRPSRFAERKDLHRHYWTNHPDYARGNNIPNDRMECPFCTYKSRSDNVLRHIEKKHPAGG
ncbi:hypothetical protein QBC44DRAFT_46142 [Cladorrhinum sp. PSN332]|nr:hypothetical protein QBC44DRAFT_46142 [Cladorrhinum sp. PSN332]